MVADLRAGKPRHVVSLSDRWMICGMTGSGKTTFARRLIAELHRIYADVPIYILDSKQSGDFRGIRGARFDKRAPGPIDAGFQVWQPPYDNQKEYDRWLGNIYQDRNPAIVVIDELSSLAVGKSITSASYPLNYAIIAKQGRALGQCLITLTQEAAYIPRQTLDQTTHLVRFYLLSDYDSRRLDIKLGRATRGKRIEEDLNPAHQHGFYYARIDRPPVRAWYYRSLEDFF